MDKLLNARVAEELRAELGRQQRSRRWLAEQTQYPLTTVARWLRGGEGMGLNEFEAICGALDRSIPDVLDAVAKNGGYSPTPAGVRRQGLEPRTRWFESFPVTHLPVAA